MHPLLSQALLSTSWFAEPSQGATPQPQPAVVAMTISFKRSCRRQPETLTRVCHISLPQPQLPQRRQRCQAAQPASAGEVGRGAAAVEDERGQGGGQGRERRQVLVPHVLAALQRQHLRNHDALPDGLRLCMYQRTGAPMMLGGTRCWSAHTTG
jgi:hypothetical protein